MAAAAAGSGGSLQLRVATGSSGASGGSSLCCRSRVGVVCKCGSTVSGLDFLCRGAGTHAQHSIQIVPGRHDKHPPPAGAARDERRQSVNSEGLCSGAAPACRRQRGVANLIRGILQHCQYINDDITDSRDHAAYTAAAVAVITPKATTAFVALLVLPPLHPPPPPPPAAGQAESFSIDT